MSDIWRLSVMENNGQHLAVHGAEEILRAAIEDWQHWMKNGEIDKYLEVLGYTDSADRADHLYVVKYENISSMSLVQIYAG